MLRTALAVLVGAALLGLSLPVVDDARVGHADSQVRTELDTLETAAERLHSESDPVAAGTPGARIERTVVLPTRSWGTAGLDRLRIPARTNERIRWQVAGGQVQTRHTNPPLVAPPDGLKLRERGRIRLTLSLERRGGAVVVVVSRADV
ncbi:DUF7311 family protein [Salinibaculum salinum]|uniref:DUF7311 family protein n=1 Tax=Salinibaculum salinum TaxID=3131996 RepID=UPI0030EC552F